MFILKISNLTPTITFRCSYLWCQGKKLQAWCPFNFLPVSLLTYPCTSCLCQGPRGSYFFQKPEPLIHPLWQDPSLPFHFHFQSSVVPPGYEHSHVSLLPRCLQQTHMFLQSCSFLRHPSLVLLPNGSTGVCHSLPLTPALSVTSPTQSHWFLSHCSTDTAFCFCFLTFNANDAVIVSGEQLRDSVIHKHCIHSPPNSPPIQAAKEHWGELPVLYSRSLLVINK